MHNSVEVEAPGNADPSARRSGFWSAVGPGLITGASDDDPSGIATYSQAGAQFGYALGWTMVLTYPLMCAIQQISAQIGRTTGHGLAGNLRQHFPNWLMYCVVGLLVVANTLNIGADLGAMAAALRLLVDGPTLLYLAGFAVLTVVLEIFVSYARYVAVLKWLALSLFAYVATALFGGIEWGAAAAQIFVPHLSLDASYITALVAIFGTTISPYLFFWQAGQEVEDTNEDIAAKQLREAPRQAPSALERIRWDTYIGMAFSNLVALAIILTTAATLHAAGHTDIQTSAEAAEALRPIAGGFAFALFALGIIGTGLLALPVLAGSAAYASGEALQWRVGLAHEPHRAKAFYATIAIATGVGALINLSPIDPVKMLFWSAVVNGVVSVPIMVMLMLLASRRSVMGQFTLSPMLKIMGWLATGVMTAAAVSLFWGMLR